MQKLLYDTKLKRLLFFKTKANSDFWDKHWKKYDLKKSITKSKNNNFIIKNTKKFLKTGRILEGGCGRGDKVYCLQENGYDAYGVDYALKTIEKIKTALPELKVSVADVRKLPFEDNFFDGYWSLGVIEHFYEGYLDILKEMKRVVRKGGYIFLTFPYMSPLRKLKAKLGLYKKLDKNKINKNEFYQYALNPESVIKTFQKYGFTFKYQKSWDGIKGFKDEVTLLKTPLQKLYDYKRKKSIIRKVRKAVNNLLKPFASHMMLLIFKNSR